MFTLVNQKTSLLFRGANLSNN